jgi:hypothetical protein
MKIPGIKIPKFWRKGFRFYIADLEHKLSGISDDAEEKFLDVEAFPKSYSLKELYKERHHAMSQLMDAFTVFSDYSGFFLYGGRYNPDYESSKKYLKRLRFVLSCEIERREAKKRTC